MVLILTVHGLNGSSLTHIPMKKYLEYYIKCNERLVIDSVNYKSKSISFDDATNIVKSYLDNFSWNSDNEFAILIGHSLGGIIVTHIDHKRIKGVITISSPHADCAFAKYIKENVPSGLSDVIFGQMYDVLTNPPKMTSVPKIICITGSILPNVKFDGQVYTNEMVHSQAYKILHLDYVEHGTQLISIRLFRLVYDAVVELINTA
jgi:pimeloyl-ACP methyl ester carboxylesterase